jgi:tRNA pseudouridine13 synthase
LNELPGDWLASALHPPRAHGQPLGKATLRAQLEDFQVDEELGFAAAGQGHHWLLQVRKRGANTEWVARDLARRARVRPHDVGFAGLKDRHAVATQWFSVPVSRGEAVVWEGFGGEGYEVLAAHPHDRKLRRGALAANRFDLLLTNLSGMASRAAIEERLSLIAAAGVPNYFGPQRFGRDAGNLLRARQYAQAVAADAGSQPARSDRSFALSAARSLIFNEVLALRVQAETWNALGTGDIANFDDGNTVFAVDELDDSLRARCQGGELHPTGPMWGAAGGLSTQGEIAALEARAAAACEPLGRWLLAEGLRAERRPLRLRVQRLSHQWGGNDASLRLQFRLNPGSFATTVLRELLDARDAHSGAEI